MSDLKLISTSETMKCVMPGGDPLKREGQKSYRLIDRIILCVFVSPAMTTRGIVNGLHQVPPLPPHHLFIPVQQVIVYLLYQQSI